MGGRLGTIALVALIRSTTDDTAPAAELIEEIREAIQSSKISEGWSIEKISILGQPEISEAGLSPSPAEKTPLYRAD